MTVTGNWGTASDNPSIATAKGWTVNGQEHQMNKCNTISTRTCRSEVM